MESDLDAGFAARVHRDMNTIAGVIISLGFQCSTPAPPQPPKTQYTIDREGPSMRRLDGPTIQQERAERIDATNEWARMGRLYRWRMTEVVDMSHRYGLSLHELVHHLVKCYQQPKDRRARLQDAAHAALVRGYNVRAYPSLGFEVWRLAAPGSWGYAASLAKQIGGLVTEAQYREWQGAQRLQHLSDRYSRRAPRSPLDGGDLDVYTKETRRRRTALYRHITDTGILPYRVTP